MKVLFWAERFLPDIGGVEVLAGHLLPVLRERYGHEIEVVCASAAATGSDDQWCGFPVHRLPFHGALLSRRLETISRLRRSVRTLVERFDPDLIHLNTGQPSLFFMGRGFAKPLIYTGHEPVLAKGPNSLLGRTLRASTFVTAVSRAVLGDLIRLCPSVEDRSVVVPCGLPIPLAKPCRAPVSPAHFFCVGRVVKGKGFDLAIRALAAVLASGRQAKLSIVGEGTALPGLRRLAIEVGIEPAVSFLGRVPPTQVASLLCQGTAVVVPSRIPEALGLVVLEAALLRRPAIAARTGGLPEVIREGESGLMFAVESVPELADRMSELIDSPELVERLGEQARLRAMREYSLEKCAGDYDRAYSSVGRNLDP
ncbi:MAG: glycosyltransferase family 4 protein [Acidobacteriota bacterium]